MTYTELQIQSIWDARTSGSETIYDPNSDLRVLAVSINDNDSQSQSMIVTRIGPATPYSDEKPSQNNDLTIYFKRSRPSNDSAWSNWSEA